MDTLRSWLFGKKDETKPEKTVNLGEEQLHNSEQKENISSALRDASQKDLIVDIPADPKVVEFFKDFPEPYRQKAIQYYSKREGLHRWDLFRDIAMMEEKASARDGIFLSDKREYEESLKELNELQREEEFEKTQAQFYQREIPEWEQRVLKYVPLQPGDTMPKKLLMTANIMAIGLVFVWQGASFLRTNHKITMFRRYTAVAGTLGLFCTCQVLAVYKLMDWDLYDNSTDHRPMYEKFADDFQKELQNIPKYLDKLGKKSDR